MKQMTFKASQGVLDVIGIYCEIHGGQIMDYLRQIAAHIENIPKGKYKVDSSDTFCSFNNVPLSFIRDWKNREVIILTTKEAQELDKRCINGQKHS